MANWFPGLAGSRYATRARVQEFLEVTAQAAVTEALQQALQELDEDTVAALGLKADQADLDLLEGRVDDAEAEILLRATIASVSASLLLKTDLTVHDILAGRVTVNEGDILALQGAVGGAASEGDLTGHTGNTSNPHSVTKTQVGLGNVDNTSDAAKPVSAAVQAALNLKLDITDFNVLEGRMDDAEGDIIEVRSEVGAGLTDVESLTAPGEVSIDHGLTLITADDAAQAFTLEDGLAGHTKLVVLAAAGAGDSAVITPDTALGWTSAELDTAGQALSLAWTPAGWAITSNNGATIT